MEPKNTEVTKSKLRINVVDVIILIAVLAAIVGMVIRFGNTGGLSGSEDLKTYEIYFTVKDIAYTSEDAFVAGDTVTLVDSGVVLGEFVGLESIMPAEFFARDQSGNLIVASYPELTRIDVTGHILSRGIMGENGYLAEGTTHVAAGVAYSVQSEHMDFVLEITNIIEK